MGEKKNIHPQKKRNTHQQGPREIGVSFDEFIRIVHQTKTLGKILGITKGNKGIVAYPPQVPSEIYGTKENDEYEKKFTARHIFYFNTIQSAAEQHCTID